MRKLVLVAMVMAVLYFTLPVAEQVLDQLVDATRPQAAQTIQPSATQSSRTPATKLKKGKR